MYTINAKQGKEFQLKSVKDLIEVEAKIANHKTAKDNYLMVFNSKLANDYLKKLNQAIEGILREKFVIKNDYKFSKAICLELGHAVHNVQIWFSVDLDSGELSAEIKIIYKFYGGNRDMYRLTKKVKSVNQIIKHSMYVINALEINEADMVHNAKTNCLAVINDAVINDKRFIKIN